MTKEPASAQTPSDQGSTVPAKLDQEFESLFASEFAFVCRTLERLGVREADVHDVAQELFLAVYRAMPEWDRARALKPWLFGFAVRFASNYRRLGWHRGRALDEEMPVQSPRMHDKLAAKRSVMRALETLDFDKRIALVMHDMEEFTAKEISEHLGISSNTVSSRVRLARDAFRAAIGKEEGSAP